MKRLLMSLLAVLNCSAILLAEAISIPNAQGVEIWYNLDEKQNVAEVTFKGKTYSEANEYSGTIIIPEEVTYNGKAYTVSSIGSNAFTDCKNLSSVTIPEKVTAIKAHAFLGCISLTEVNFNAINCVNAAERKGTKTYPAFEDCKSITNLNFGDKVVYIPDFAFWGCTGIKSITIPENVQKIGGGAFYDCTGITTINFNAANCISAAGNMNGKNVPAFMNTSVSIVNFGPLVNVIPDYAFFGCKGLTSITIPENITRIGGGAFRECPNLTTVNFNAVHCSTAFSSAGDAIAPAFNNPAITTVVFGSKVEEIPSYLFWGCKGLTNITMSENTTTIGTSAFYDCISLTSITIPSDVTSIGGHAFKGCSNLTTVNFDAVYCTNATTLEKGKIIPAFENSSITTILFANDVKNIPDHAFEGCSGLINITLSESLNNIGENAFAGCSAMKSITIPENVSTIGGGAFSNCINLVSVNFNAKMCTGASKIEGKNIRPAFENCSALTDFNIGEEVKIIPDYMLAKCPALKKLTIPAAVTTIGGFSFAECSNLDVINFNAINCTNVTTTTEEKGEEIVTSSFGTQSITTVKFGPEVKVIPDKAFKGSRRLSVIELPESLERIGNQAFADCSAIKKITIPENVTSIGGDAFRGCTSLYTVNFNAMKCDNVVEFDGDLVIPAFNNESIGAISFGSKVEYIPDYLFYGCIGVIKVTIPKNVTRIGAYSFYNCASLPMILIPENVTSIGGGAFEKCERLEYVMFEAANCTNAMTIIGDSVVPVFNDPSIKDIYIGKKVQTIPEYLFYGSTGLKELVIPKNITAIGGNAFGNCLSLKTLIFEALDCQRMSTVMGDSIVTAFNNCPAIASVTLNPKLEAIPDYAFYGFKGLRRIEIPEKVTRIGDYAFYGCELMTRLNLPDKVTAIGKFAVAKSGLTGINISSTIKEIGDGAFSGCKKLSNINVRRDNEYYTSVGGALYDKDKTTLIQYPVARSNAKFVIESTVTNIGSGAFYGCSVVSEIVFPDGVSYMGKDVFKECKNIKKITINAVNPPYVEGDKLFDDETLDATLKVPVGSVHQYLTNPAWKLFSTITEY